MLRKVYLKGGRTLTFLLGLLTICSLLTPSIASAASVYDNTLVLTSDLKYNDENEGVYSIATTWQSHMLSACGSTIYDDFRQSLEGGAWAVSQDGTDDDYGVTVVWSKPDHTVPQAHFVTATNPNIRYLGVDPGWQGKARFHFNSYTDTNSCDYSTAAINNPYGSTLTREDWSSPLGLFLSTYEVVYPTGYAGTVLSYGSSDNDEDGLNLAKELTQGTSDNDEDTDGDGLSDNIESQWYSSRSAVFCGSQCAYPDPVVKDVYVEVDWMDSGTTEYKPTSTQLGLVEDSLDDQGYNVHIDTGQYGGGEELSDYIEYLPLTFGATPVGFFDLKNGNVSESIPANFSSDRQGIWRYLISGYGVGEDHDLSGGSYAGSDNILIATGYIYDHPGFGYNDVETAIAGTIVHELGHSLCMSKLQSYSYQSTDCRYSGVDTAAASTYDSVLNYNLQMFQTNLSNGGNGTGDHDDWGAIDGGGIADFSQWDTSEADFEPGVNLKKAKPSKITMKRGISLEQAQAAKRNGTLGIVTRNGKSYDLKKKNGSNLPLVLNSRIRPSQ